jgi:hypothetical protein
MFKFALLACSLLLIGSWLSFNLRSGHKASEQTQTVGKKTELNQHEFSRLYYRHKICVGSTDTDSSRLLLLLYSVYSINFVFLEFLGFTGPIKKKG